MVKINLIFLQINNLTILPTIVYVVLFSKHIVIIYPTSKTEFLIQRFLVLTNGLGSKQFTQWFKG